MGTESCDALVVGGGPAGLRAAEVISATGARVVLADRMPSAGRKFLVAGRGGLNLTHAEPREKFRERYGEPEERWRDLLEGFSPEEMRAWAKGLGIETFVGTSRRVFPTGKQAAPLLRRWIERLRKQGVVFRFRHKLAGFREAKDGGWEIEFKTPKDSISIRARAVIFALGGASWPQTGSDGSWTPLFAKAGIPVMPLVPANVGYEVDWPRPFLNVAEGRPLKNLVVRAGEESVAGELLVTKYGLEGGALYQLGRTLRGLAKPEIRIDFKPSFTAEQLRAKPMKAWRLSPAAEALLKYCAPPDSGADLSALAKAFPISLRGPRPIAEAISTAGGVAWEALDDELMLRSRPGLFCAGEMIDWEGPTGGYLLQGCLATGTRAGRGVAKFLQSGQSR